MALTWPPTTHADVTAQALIRHGAVPGRYYTSPGSAITGAAYTLNTLYYTPLFIPVGTVDRLASRVTTASAAASGGVLRFGLYSASATGVPDALLVDGGTVSTESTGSKEVTVSVVLAESGWYWGAIVAQVVTSTCIVTGSADGSWGGFTAAGTLSEVGTGTNNGMTQSNVTGALPATATPAAGVGNMGRVWYRQTP